MHIARGRIVGIDVIVQILTRREQVLLVRIVDRNLHRRYAVKRGARRIVRPAIAHRTHILQANDLTVWTSVDDDVLEFLRLVILVARANQHLFLGSLDGSPSNVQIRRAQCVRDLCQSQIVLAQGVFVQGNLNFLVRIPAQGHFGNAVLQTQLSFNASCFLLQAHEIHTLA